MEKSFTAIGSSVLVGAAAGGVFGLYDGVRQTALAGLEGKLRRVQVMNYTLKSGATASNSLGAIAVMYSSAYILLSYVREDDDELKSLVSLIRLIDLSVLVLTNPFHPCRLNRCPAD